MKTELLYKIAKSKRISMDQIAKEMGVSKMQAYRYLNNPNRLSADQIVLLATVLDRSPRNLFSLIINN